jgi:hypothetical protein
MFPYQDLVFFLGVKIIMEATFAMILPTVDVNQKGRSRQFHLLFWWHIKGLSDFDMLDVGQIQDPI